MRMLWKRIETILDDADVDNVYFFLFNFYLQDTLIFVINYIFCASLFAKST